MSSNSPVPLATIKSVNNSPAQTSSTTQSHISSSFGIEAQHYAQRRSGGSGSSGAGSASRSSLSSPRNYQSYRKPHKNQRKPNLAGEDPIAVAMRSASSRKGQTSITHLMNFTLPPRPQNNHFSHQGRGARRNPAWGLGSGYHAIDKARYVNANYRFIVDPKGDYTAQTVDPDVHLDWNSVLQILASAQTQCSSCPICLSTPVAPRMAKCGHIFCLPCLIRYMHSTDETQSQPEKKARWKKCPICWDSVYLSEVRPVRWFMGQEGKHPREGGDVVLRLMSRQPRSTLALPRDGASVPPRTEDIPWHFAAEVADYARIMKGTEEYMRLQFESEILDLEKQEHDDELMFGEETEWTKKAVRLIRETQEKIKGMGDPPSPETQPVTVVDRPKRKPIKFNENDRDVPDMYLVQHAAKSGQSSSGGASTPHGHIPSDATSDSSISARTDTASTQSIGTGPQLPPSSLGPQHPSSSAIALSFAQTKGRADGSLHTNNAYPYFFYQALLHYYLSPLDIRILKAAFGDYSAFPATILPRVEHVTTGHIVDDDLRKRAKYLGHLPYGCEVGFLECDLTDVVAPEVLEKFKNDIERRRKRNKDKETREEKERMRAEKDDEEKRWAAARRKRPSIHYENAAEESAGSFDAARTSSSVDLNSISASPPWSSRNPRGSAFASLASPSTSPVAPRTVWGTAAIVPSSPVTVPQPTHHDHDVSDHDGWLQGWEEELQLENEMMQVVIAEANSTFVEAPSVGKKKKGKGKKITLMSTNARRGA